ncbi:Uncharacterized protein TCM_044806 [Theobroma cacao]|uniref:Uncharacterized protein n=1 Tax=Theobroma cacao TaxID=3641 RepID=A0A061FSP9_THECC|nr:Uncharacterized protein TCM_044806 [Theobroma cacao]
MIACIIYGGGFNYIQIILLLFLLGTETPKIKNFLRRKSGKGKIKKTKLSLSPPW